MPDWIGHLALLQGGVVRSLAAELRDGGLGTPLLVFEHRDGKRAGQQLDRAPRLERNVRVLQGMADAVIVAFALWTGVRLLAA